MSLAAALLLSAGITASAPGEVISLVSQERLVTARATLTPTNPPGPDDSVSQTFQAPGYGPFEALAGATRQQGGQPLASGEARQVSSIVGALVHAEGRAAASGTCAAPVACGTGEATSSFAIGFAVPVSMMVHIRGTVTTETGAPRLRFAIIGPGVTLVSDGNGGSDNINLDALLTPGEYSLEALVRSQSGDAGSFKFDATFDAVLVGVATSRWGDVKQLFR